MSKKDQIISLILPALVVLFVYFWFVRRPFERDYTEQRQIHARFEGMEEAELRQRNQSLARQVEQEKEKQRDALRQIEREREALRRANVSTSADEARLRRMIALADAQGLRLLSAKRFERLTDVKGSFLPDLTGVSSWAFQLQGGYPQILKFLQMNREKGISIPYSIEMAPAVEPGKETDWLVQFLL